MPYAKAVPESTKRTARSARRRSLRIRRLRRSGRCLRRKGTEGARILDVVTRPYGTWPSSLDAVTVARASGKRLAPLGYAGGRLRWQESRPADGGRSVVMDERDGELTPAGASVRTRAHEYGGGAAWLDGEDVYYSEFSDARVYRLGHGPITPRDRDPPH